MQTIRRSARGRRAMGFLVIVAAVLLLGQLAAAQLPPADEQIRDSTLSRGEGRTPSGEIISDIWIKVVWVSSAIFLLVTVILVYSLVRWRRRPGVKREVPQIHGNSKLEIAWTIGPALIMIWLLVISYNGLMAIDLQEEEPEFVVDVVGTRFLWEFTYPDGNQTDTLLRLEAGRWVQLNVTGGDVIHAFAIPGLDVMVDAIPGRENQVRFYTGDEPGIYLAQCRQFCGATGHGEMLAAVEIFARGAQPLPYGAAPRPTPPAPTQPDGNETQGPPSNVTVDRTVDVRLFDMFFEPAPLDLEPGETVLIQVTNDGPGSHNLYIGSYDFSANEGEPVCPEEGDPGCWNTPTLQPGGTASFVLTAPIDPVAYDMWCSVPGHVPSGMITFASVGGAEPGGGPSEPRLPGPGLALVVVALAGFLAVVRWRRAPGQQG